MKKWAVRIIVPGMAVIVAAGIYLYFELQPPKLDVETSPDGKHSIFSHYGSEHQDLPYAPVVYIERHAFLPILNETEQILMGYCGIEYSWLSNNEAKVICVNNSNNKVIKSNNSFGVNVLFEIKAEE